MTASTDPPSPFDSKATSLTEPLLSREDEEAQTDEEVLLVYDEETCSSSEFRSRQLRNVKKIFAVTWFAFASRSIWSQSALSIFVYLLKKDSPDRIGYMTAAMGVSQVFSSMVTGCVSDRWKRNNILRLSSFAGAAAVGLTTFSVMTTNYEYLLFSLCLWGVMWGSSDTALPSLFSDSIPDDDTQQIYQKGSRIIKSANMIGPLIALGVFQYLGDEWTIMNCSIVIGVGLAFSLPVLLILCALSEIYFDEGFYFDPPEEILLSDDKSFDKIDPADPLSPQSSPCASPERDRGPTTVGDISGASQDKRVCCCFTQNVVVPSLITISDVLSSVASGMSMRYFPVFLASTIGLSPVRVQGLHLLAPFGQAASSALAKSMASRFGPGCVSIVFHWTFVLFLLSMVHCVDIGMSTTVVVVLYVLHASLMNSTCSLSRSIMTSVLAEEEVYKWTVAESVQLLLWSGGAALGGVLVGKDGIEYCFYATSGLQLIASLPLLMLCCVMTSPSKENENSDSLPGTPRTALNENESYDYSETTVFEETRERVESDESNFFDCEVAATSDEDRTTEVAVYTHGECLYRDGSPAFVPSGECMGSIPESYISITHGSRKRARDMWENTQTWRREKEVWKMLTIPNPWHLKIKDAYPHYIHGWTKQGDIVIYEQPGKMKLKQLFRDGCTIEIMVTWYTLFMEYLSNIVVPAIAEARGSADNRRNFSFFVVMDMEDAGMTLLSSEVLNYLKKAGEINSSHYPTSMKQTTLIKTGPLFSKLSSVLQAVLPRQVQFEVYSEENYQAALRECIVSTLQGGHA
jgi:MFS family permease